MSKRDRVIMIVDRSGSMGRLAKEASAGINRFIKEQQEIDTKCDFQLVQFDDQYEAFPIQDIQKQGEYLLIPGGMTAMLDAIGRTLSGITGWPKKTYKKNICVIVTDGLENASKEWTYDGISKLVGGLEKEGWEFVFMASNIDAKQAAWDIGTRTAATVDTVSTAEGQTVQYAAASGYVGTLRTDSKAKAMKDLDDAKKRSSEIS